MSKKSQKSDFSYHHTKTLLLSNAVPKDPIRQYNSSAVTHFSISENVFHQLSIRSKTEQYNPTSHISHISQGSEIAKRLTARKKHLFLYYQFLGKSSLHSQQQKKKFRKQPASPTAAPLYLVQIFKPKDTRQHIQLSIFYSILQSRKK